MTASNELERLLDDMAAARISIHCDRTGRVSVRPWSGAEIPPDLRDRISRMSGDLLAYMRGEIRVAHCLGCRLEDACDGRCSDNGGYVPRPGWPPVGSSSDPSNEPPCGAKAEGAGSNE